MKATLRRRTWRTEELLRVLQPRYQLKHMQCLILDEAWSLELTEDGKDSLLQSEWVWSAWWFLYCSTEESSGWQNSIPVGDTAACMFYEGQYVRSVQ